MRVLSLDLATCTGWAILESKESAVRLVDYGNFKVKRSSRFYPYSYIIAAKEVAEDVESIYNQHCPDYIVVEDTNKGQQRYTQKFLEFIHFAVFDRFLNNSCNFEKIYYPTLSEDKYNIYPEIKELSKTCPIFLYDKDSKTIYQEFPSLKELGVNKVIDAIDLWILLSEWLGNRITEKEPIVPIGDDKTRILSAGFDLKTSFRNIK